MNTVSLIKKKRDKEELTNSEISFLVSSFSKNLIPDYQFSAFLMAGFLNGFTEKETSYLTKAMLYSGKIIDLSHIPGKKVDKHSTGGVGDKTSLIIAPIVAAAGVNVPMISGRGLGHSGGTLDKLESIPGFNTNLSLSQYQNILQKCGAVLIGQTKDVAPADKLIYALRDVTATVESIPLITGSIMSKKLAEGIDGLVLDVKTGSGAFMKTLKDADKLATSLIDTAKSFDKKVIAFITDMNQPLGNYIGNWLEVYESIKILNGEKVDGLYELSLNLSGAMIFLGGKAKSIEEGYGISEELIKNGKAFDKFLQIVNLQKGDTRFVKNPKLYPKSKYNEIIYSEKSGYLKSIDNYQIGMASLELGSGRITKTDIIDPTAGIIFYPKIGNKINKGEKIAELFSNKKIKIDETKSMILNSLTISSNKVKPEKLIKKIIS
ncbi:MAG: thymidine phosphorylase [Melioribacteraceae bacterium]|jgi:pyrimidine-nucleoside phosphorylase